MPTTVVLGAIWGDEGKGKLVDILCDSVDICARCAGGNNAGHTIVANGVTYDFHILPSGEFILSLIFQIYCWVKFVHMEISNIHSVSRTGLVNPKCVNLVGSGCVVHVPSFFQELENVQKKGLNTEDRIYISDRAHLVFDLHQLVDGLEEVELGAQKIGTTRKGIGPTYSTKAARSGIRIYELFNWPEFEKRFRALAYGYKKRFGDLLEYDEEEELGRYKVRTTDSVTPHVLATASNFHMKEYAEKLRLFVIDAVVFMADAQKKNAKILVEGANALMLDIDYGTYPYVTSSNTGIGGVLTGLAISPFNLKNVIGVVKAYTTRVGAGPFVTEQLNVRNGIVYIEAQFQHMRELTLGK